MGQKFTSSQRINNNTLPMYLPRDGYNPKHSIPSVTGTQYFKIFEFDGNAAGAYSNSYIKVESLTRQQHIQWVIGWYTDATGNVTTIEDHRLMYTDTYGTVFPTYTITTSGQLYTGYMQADHYVATIYRLKFTNGGIASSGIKPASFDFFDEPVSTTIPSGATPTRVKWSY